MNKAQVSRLALFLIWVTRDAQFFHNKWIRKKYTLAKDQTVVNYGIVENLILLGSPSAVFSAPSSKIHYFFLEREKMLCIFSNHHSPASWGAKNETSKVACISTYLPSVN